MVFVLLEFENTNIPREPFGQNMTKNIHRNILETYMSSMTGERIFKKKHKKTPKPPNVKLWSTFYTQVVFSETNYISLCWRPHPSPCVFFLERLRFKFGATKRESLEVGWPCRFDVFSRSPTSWGVEKQGNLCLETVEKLPSVVTYHFFILSFF